MANFMNHSQTVALADHLRQTDRKYSDYASAARAIGRHLEMRLTGQNVAGLCKSLGIDLLNKPTGNRSPMAAAFARIKELEATVEKLQEAIDVHGHNIREIEEAITREN